MNHPPTDRRIARTRQALHQAMVELILEKGYDDITVQDLLDRANVGRSTFYAHYRDKEELLVSGFTMLLENFRAQYLPELNDLQSGREAARKFSQYLFCHVEENRMAFKAMFGRQSHEVVVRYARQSLTDVIRSHLSGVYPASRSIPIEITIDYLISSFLSLVAWWLDHATRLTAEDMNRIYWDLVMPGVQKVFAPLD